MAIIEYLTANPAIVLLVADIVLSVFQFLKTGKVNKTLPTTQGNIVDQDLSALLAYHESVAAEIRKKIKKE